MGPAVPIPRSAGPEAAKAPQRWAGIQHATPARASGNHAAVDGDGLGGDVAGTQGGEEQIRAQVDTAQNASWCGTWVSPPERTILKFEAGSVTRTIRDTGGEFAVGRREIDRWNRDQGYGPAWIDSGFDPALKAAFEAVGPGDMLRRRSRSAQSLLVIDKA